ncbi:hypothetical protein PUN28_011276 [Cardiocondyla obscurior]|uniref:ATPase AAA-type core domain-containing protein n=1 Tax=Cardiocondyla obscurior TaxID=286306 RepID=A0AAW2FI35_9HYME
MSYYYYNELWLITRGDLEKLLEFERQLQKSAPLRKKAILNSALSMYVRYRNIVRRLIMCYDQMVQTQKRELIKKMLDCAIGRMLECKSEIVKFDKSDYQWPDNILNEMKFTLDDIELFASVSGRERTEDRKRLIREVVEKTRKVSQIAEQSFSQIESTAETEDETLRTRVARRKKHTPQVSKVELIRESPEDKAAREVKLAAEQIMHNALLLIQSHERARKGRCYSADVKRIYDYNKRVMSGKIIPQKIDRNKYIKSALTIQRAWRRYTARRIVKKRIVHLDEALDMTIPSWQCRKVIAKDIDNFQRRRALMTVFDAQIKKAIDDERARLLRVRGPGLMEDITDEIHEWFIVWYNTVGHFDVFPAADLTGSVLIATGQTLTPQEYLMEKLEKTNRKGRKTEKMALPPKAQVLKDQEKVLGWKMPQTDALSCLEKTNIDFIQNWNFRNKKDPEQVYLDLITENLCYELQLEMRKIVDELMRAELELLNKALLKDQAQDKKKEKFTVRTRDKSIKINIDKIKKQEKKENLEDIAAEDLFGELLQAEIIRNYQTIFLRDWFGDYSYQNYEARRELRGYKHQLGEIKQLVLEYCVLPLISKETHQVAPLVRSVCIYGLPGTGKTWLADAISSEIGALLFDVSASVLVNKYTGKEEQQRLINIIYKVARAYAPSIIFLDAGETPWLKKIPPEKTYLQPKRFADYFVKLMKAITPGDQVLFLSLSEEPQRGSGAFIKFYDKFIRMPTTDYNTLYMFYKHLLMKYHGIDRNIDVSCLAKMSIGIPLNFISQIVEKVLSPRRRVTLKFNPLNPMEILNEILTYQHPTIEMTKNIDKFEKRMLIKKKKKCKLRKTKLCAIITGRRR